MRKLLYICFLCLLTVAAYAEETILVGNVHDAATGEPMANVNVYFRGTKVGTTTSEEGFFFLRVDLKAKMRLVISAVGYKRQQYEIEPGQSAGLELFLEEKTNELETVIALPGSNPALPLMAGVRAHRRENARLAEIDLPSENTYFISDIQPRHLKRRLWRNLQDGMIRQADSSYLLPLPKEAYLQYALPLPEHFNLYESTVPLHEASFLSPLAASANTFYNFWLLDSTVVRFNEKEEKHYRVRFVPKNSFNPTLSGTLEIDSATYALREVQAHVAREVNVNYLTDFRYKASYGPDSRLREENLTTLMEIAVKKDTSHLFPSLLASRRSVAPEGLHPDTVLALDSAATVYVRERQPEAIVLPDDSLVAAITDSLMELPLFRVARWAAISLYTGYIPTGTPVDIGRATDIFGLNRVEQVHLGLPFRTNEKFCRYFSIGGSVGYGIRDRGVKYRLELQGLLPAERRHLIGVSLSDRYADQDVSAFGALKVEDGIELDNRRFTDRLFGGIPNRTASFVPLARKREVRFFSENDWCASDGIRPQVETQLSVQLGHQGFGNPVLYHYYDMPSYRYASIRGILRLGWGERSADFFMRRRRLYSQYPTVFIGAEMGSYQLEEMPSYRMYGLLNLLIRQDVHMGLGGRLTYLVEAGLVLGRVPYPLLSIMNGNSGYTYSDERFTLMNSYQYAADHYVFAHLHWDGKGILFNQIPGVRYARLHELVEMKVAYGGLSDKHRSVIDYTEFFGADRMQPLRVPYVEMGVGLGNIFRVCDVYSIWRLTNRQDLSAARWGVRFRFRIGL